MLKVEQGQAILAAVTPRTNIIERLLRPREEPTRLTVLNLDSPGPDKVERLGLARWFFSPSTISAVCFSILVFAALVHLRGPLALVVDSGYPSILLMGLVGGIVATLGGLTGYVLGTRTSQDIPVGRIYGRLGAFVRRWTGPSLFTFAILPGPLMMVSLWAGSARYPLWRFLLYVTVGKVTSLTGLAFVGYNSAPWLLRPLG